MDGRSLPPERKLYDSFLIIQAANHL